MIVQLDNYGTNYAGQPLRAVVAIVASGAGNSFGNGFFLHPWVDTVVTAAHVVSGASRVTVLARAANGAPIQIDASAMFVDHGRDIALLRFDGIVAIAKPLHGALATGSLAVALLGHASLDHWRAMLPTEAAALASPSGPWLVYDRPMGSEGNSGGPVVTQGPHPLVVGVHRGEPGMSRPHAALCWPELVARYRAALFQS